MAATYVQISREEFEDYLTSTIVPILRKSWSRKGTTAGVYVFPLSDFASLEISSSIGTRDEAMGVGNAAIHVRLKSADGRLTLNGKGEQDSKSRVNRTSGWRDSLTKLVRQYVSTYQKSPRFYDTISKYGKFDNYLEHWKDQIRGVNGWENSEFLGNLMGQLSSKKMLSEAQEAAVVKSISSSKSFDFTHWLETIEGIQDWEKSSFLAKLHESLSNHVTISSKAQKIVLEIVDKNRWLDLLRELWKKADLADRQVLTDIGTSLRKDFRKNKPTPTEIDILEKRFPEVVDRKFSRLGQITDRVASMYMLR
jgi:hypothetical protein